MDWTGGRTLNCGSPAALFLAVYIYMVPEQITHYRTVAIHEGLCTQCVMAFSSMMYIV